MRVAVIADVHLGNHRIHGGEKTAGLNDRAWATLSVLEAAVAHAVKRKVPLVIAGDLFDDVKTPPQLLAFTGQILAPARDAGVVALLGNHDQASDAEKDNSISPLACAGVEVAQRPSAHWGGHVLAVPFLKGSPFLDCFNATRPLLESPGAVFGHAGIWDSKAPSYLQGSGESVHIDALFAAMAERGTKAAVLGDWHAHRSWSRGGAHAAQCGALVPTGWDNPSESVRAMGGPQDPYGSVVIVDTETGEWEREVVPGPRFFTTRDTSIPAQLAEVLEDDPSPLWRFHVRLLVSPDAIGQADTLVSPMRSDQLTVDVLADEKDVAKRLGEAAVSVRRADTFDDALRAYVSTAPYEGADRSAVLQLCQELVSKNGVR